MAAQYRNPAIDAAFAVAEPLPVVLIFALVSAAILSRRKKDGLVVDNSAARKVTETHW